METLTSYVNVLTIFCLLLSGLTILIKATNTPSKWRALLFISSVALFMSMDFIPPGMVKIILISGSFLLPFSFWILSNSVFTDRPYSPMVIVVLAILTLVIQYFFYFSQAFDFGKMVSGLSLAFVLLAFVEARKQSRTDLVEGRKKIRNIFTYVSSILIAIVIFSELTESMDQQEELTKLVARSSILIFSSYFLIANVSMSTVFLGSHQNRENIDPELVIKILRIVSAENLYRKEALTIGQLAEIIEEQEYKVRQAINQELGYRNFTDFINSFRIQESKDFFSDPTKQDMTVLEVAYSVGFNSIRSFNRAFKLATNKTPTEFRRSI